MYLVDALTVLARRWYVVLAGVLIMAGGTAAVFAYVPTTYQSSGQMVLLLPPEASGTGEPVNPYLNLQTGLTTAASLVSGAASTKDVAKEMAEEGFDAEYAVAVVPGTGPLITVTAKDSDPRLATATRDAMMAWIDVELRRIQEEVDVPRAQYISATRSSVSRTAEALPGSKLRALAAMVAVVGMLTLVATFGFDRLLGRRAARRASRPAPQVSGAAPTPEPQPRAETQGTQGEQEASDAEGTEGLVLTFHTERPPALAAGQAVETARRHSGRKPRTRNGR